MILNVAFTGCLSLNRIVCRIVFRSRTDDEGDGDVRHCSTVDELLRETRHEDTIGMRHLRDGQGGRMVKRHQTLVVGLRTPEVARSSPPCPRPGDAPCALEVRRTPIASAARNQGVATYRNSLRPRASPLSGLTWSLRHKPRVWPPPQLYHHFISPPA